MAKKKIEEAKGEVMAPAKGDEPIQPVVPVAHVGAGSLGVKGKFAANQGAAVSSETVRIKTSEHQGARMYVTEGCIHFDANGEADVPRSVAEKVKGFDQSVVIL